MAAYSPESVSMELSSGKESDLPWFALHVKHKHEKRVCLSLAGKQFHAFVPTYRNTHRNGAKFDLPIFPGYVFCRMDSSKPLPVVSTPGVFRVVSSSSRPNSIPEEEIDAIRRLTLSEFLIRPAEYPPPGQEVFLRRGPFKGLRGVVVDSSNQRWLTVSVHLLQRSVAVKLDWDAVLSGS